MTPDPDVSVLMLSWNTEALTLACLGALEADETRYGREILVLDNASDDTSVQAIGKRFPHLSLRVAATNLGYAAGNDRLAGAARGRYLCLLGSDTEVQPGAVDALVDFLDKAPQYAAAAPRLVAPDGSLQRACMRWPTLTVALVYDMWWSRWPLLRRIDDNYHCRDFDHLHDADVLQPPGTCLLVRREVWEQLNGMDERMWLFFNDVDLCRRMADCGEKVRYLATPEVMHHAGASTRTFRGMAPRWAKDRIAYYSKHYGRLGRWIVRGMIRLRAMQEWWVLGRRHGNPQHRRDARADLKRVVRQALS
ncbi:MAG: hypothetical protein CMJ85_03475 [Planctomycetes bacterium]|nr:hypothetical protein [Planctomycetota bacterium]